VQEPRRDRRTLDHDLPEVIITLINEATKALVEAYDAVT